MLVITCQLLFAIAIVSRAKRFVNLSLARSLDRWYCCRIGLRIGCPLTPSYNRGFWTSWSVVCLFHGDQPWTVDRAAAPRWEYKKSAIDAIQWRLVKAFVKQHTLDIDKIRWRNIPQVKQILFSPKVRLWVNSILLYPLLFFFRLITITPFPARAPR
jgi:hypothetical protein